MTSGSEFIPHGTTVKPQFVSLHHAWDLLEHDGHDGACVSIELHPTTG